MKKRKILMLILFVSTVLLSGCGKTFLSNHKTLIGEEEICRIQKS